MLGKMEGDISMDLVNKKVVHITFGEGNIVDQNDSYINIDFESGIKKFTFPDVFGEYITINDEKYASLIKEKLKIKEEEQRIEKIKQEKEKILELERRRIEEEAKRTQGRKIHPKLQSVFWCEPDEIDEIFTEWKVFTGEIKSGKKEGEPRKLARMNQKSACLLTCRDEDMDEEDRYIIGLFMTDRAFDGRTCEDGYIPAHPDYRIRLSKEESEKMLFWNYYVNKTSPENTTWNSGRQRYFDNIWLAQILQDIISLREDPKEKKKVKKFLEYFNKMNRIDKDEIPEPEGALMQDSE